MTRLSSAPLHFHEGSAQLGLLLTLSERLLEQTSKTVLLPVNPEDVLHFLPGTRARNLDVQECASHDLVACEPACSCEVLEVRNVRITKPHNDSMFEIPHLASTSMAIALSRRNVVSHARISRRR